MGGHMPADTQGISGWWLGGAWEVDGRLPKRTLLEACDMALEHPILSSTIARATPSTLGWRAAAYDCAASGACWRFNTGRRNRIS